MLTHHACDPFLGWVTHSEHHPNDENLLSKNQHEQKGSNQWLWMGQKKGHAMSLDVPTQMIEDHLFHNTCVACSSSPLSSRSLLLGHWHWTMMKGLKRLHGQGFDAWNVCVFSGCVRWSQSWSTAPLLCYVCACCSRKPADVLGSKVQPFWLCTESPLSSAWISESLRSPLMPVGKCVIRTAVSDMFTLWPPAPGKRRWSFRTLRFQMVSIDFQRLKFLKVLPQNLDLSCGNGSCPLKPLNKWPSLDIHSNKSLAAAIATLTRLCCRSNIVNSPRFYSQRLQKQW